jgi:hypothetical protein
MRGATRRAGDPEGAVDFKPKFLKCFSAICVSGITDDLGYTF